MLLTTHDMADIEQLCSRLLIIDHGRLIWDGGLDEIRDRHGRERTLVVDLEEPAPPLEVPGARVVRVDGPRQWLAFRRDETSAAELTAAVAARDRLRRPGDRGDGDRGDRQADLRSRSSSSRVVTTTSAGG